MKNIFKKTIVTYLCLSAGIVFLIGNNSFADGVIKADSKPDSNYFSNIKSPNRLSVEIIPPVPKIQINAAAWVLMDYQTGTVLAEKNMRKQRKPASLAKIVTAYIIAQALKSGTIKWDNKVIVSNKAWRTGGSKMFIKPTDKLTVGDLMQGMIVQSGNDATVALAEDVAGSESAFVTAYMNPTVKKLGMTDSHFANVSGLPAKGQYTSAYDMAIIAQSFIYNFPTIYKLYSQKSFTWNGITQHNRNKLLYSNPYVDGMKTGYTRAAGYNLVSSAKKDGERLIAVVLGTPNPSSRIQDSNKLLTYGFRFFTTHTFYKVGDIIKTSPVADAVDRKQVVNLSIDKELALTIPKGQIKFIQAQVKINNNIAAPIASGEKLGTLTLNLENKQVAQVDLVATENITKAGFFTRVSNKIKNWF